MLTDKRFETFKTLLPYLQEEMKRKHVTLKLLWEEYRNEHPDNHYSLTQFRFHYNQNTEAGKESPSTILADMRTGGEKLFLDLPVIPWDTLIWKPVRSSSARLS